MKKTLKAFWFSSPPTGGFLLFDLMLQSRPHTVFVESRNSVEFDSSRKKFCSNPMKCSVVRLARCVSTSPTHRFSRRLSVQFFFCFCFSTPKIALPALPGWRLLRWWSVHANLLQQPLREFKTFHSSHLWQPKRVRNFWFQTPTASTVRIVPRVSQSKPPKKLSNW